MKDGRCSSQVEVGAVEKFWSGKGVQLFGKTTLKNLASVRQLVYSATQTSTSLQASNPRITQMSNAQGSMDAAASERKARLAKLASLKRKQPGADTTVDVAATEESTESQESKTDAYLSGRNYDRATKAPKLGFESAPNADVETVEKASERIAAEAREQAAKDEAENEKGIDLFKLQPKKPNWDLKRELAEKMKVVDVRTQNAIAKMVRERIERSKKKAQSKTALQPSSTAEGTGEEVGIEGTTLTEAVHQREREEQEERERESEFEMD